jgi:hypothetical protein
MAIKAGWRLAIIVALMVSAAPQVQAGQTQSLSAGSNCNSWEGDLAIVALDNRPVRNTKDLRDVLGKLQPDDTIYLTVLQQLPSGRKAIKIAFRVGNAKQSAGSSSTITAKQNAAPSEDYYEMISGCENCVIPGVELGGVEVHLIVNEDDSVTPPVKRGLFSL